MTLKNALNNFERLSSETSIKSEIKIYKEFIHILSGLRNKNLPGADIDSIETELGAIDLTTPPANRKKYFKKALNQFKKYLRDSFSLIPKGYYTNMGIALGSSFGLAFGSIFSPVSEMSMSISLALSIGTFIGIIVGSSLDSQVKASGKAV